MELEEYLQYHEKKLHERSDLCFNTYICTIPLDFPRVDLHWHEQMEIVYIKKGEGTVTVGACPYRVGAGAIVPIMPGELHAIEVLPGGRMEYENMIFSLSILDCVEERDWLRPRIIEPLQSARFRLQRPIVPGTAFHTEASAALDGIDRAGDSGDSGYAILVKSELFRFLHALYAHAQKPGNMAKKTHENALKTILGYVKEHFSEEITVEQAAALVGYSSSHFMRLFREEAGITFTAYVRDYRISYASYLLRESEGSVGEIAMECGFNNYSYFIRSFTKRYGVSPGKYRKERSGGLPKH